MWARCASRGRTDGPARLHGGAFRVRLCRACLLANVPAELPVQIRSSLSAAGAAGLVLLAACGSPVAISTPSPTASAVTSAAPTASPTATASPSPSPFQATVRTQADLDARFVAMPAADTQRLVLASIEAGKVQLPLPFDPRGVAFSIGETTLTTAGAEPISISTTSIDVPEGTRIVKVAPGVESMFGTSFATGTGNAFGGGVNLVGGRATYASLLVRGRADQAYIGRRDINIPPGGLGAPLLVTGGNIGGFYGNTSLFMTVMDCGYSGPGADKQRPMLVDDFLRVGERIVYMTGTSPFSSFPDPLPSGPCAKPDPKVTPPYGCPDLSFRIAGVTDDTLRKGTLAIRGKVTMIGTGQPLRSVTAVASETFAASSDVDGSYRVCVPPGTHLLRFRLTLSTGGGCDFYWRGTTALQYEGPRPAPDLTVGDHVSGIDVQIPGEHVQRLDNGTALCRP